MPVVFNDDDWNFNSMDDLNQEATLCLRSAMIYERRKKWKKVVECYERLIWLIDLKHFSDDYEAPPTYDMLLYELFNHLGVAYQHLDEHKKSIVQYSKAFEIVSIPKNGCLAGCVTNSCLMTPIMTRRAFAFIKVGNTARALKDAEKAVVLDSKNPDVYCIRALVRGSRDEDVMGLSDVDMALKLKPDNVCALMIRGAISRPLLSSALIGLGRDDTNEYHLKAERMDPAAQNFNTVSNFHHPAILEFFDRFFFTLSVPHTITEVNLFPVRISRRQLELRAERNRPKTAQTSSASVRSPLDRPFRCGTACCVEQEATLTRRNEYGDAVRKHMSRPKTASDFIALLEKERQKKFEMATRTTPMTSQGMSSDSGKRRSLNNSRMSSFKSLTFEPQNNYIMPVFQSIDLKNASRMYYKPWKGDKLPVADVKRFEPIPPFY